MDDKVKERHQMGGNMTGMIRRAGKARTGIIKWFRVTKKSWDRQ